MRKTFFYCTIVSMILAIIQTISVIARYNQNDSDLVVHIASVVILYFLSAVYGFFELRCIKDQRKIMQKHTDNYRLLKDLYNNISLNDSKSKYVFYIGVREFADLTYAIISEDFPKKWKKYAENMLEDLICCVVYVQSE